MEDTEDVTGSHSEGAASDYHQLQDHQKIVGEALISLAGVRLVEKVLDLGCGTGHFAVVLSELVGPEGRVVAVDPDAERIKIAKECNTRPNIKFLVENDQTFPGQEYDLVFCNHVIQRVIDKVALFKRLHDKLRSGGSFVFLTFNGTPEFTTNILDAFAEFAGPDFHHKLMYQQQMWETASTYQELAEAAGFIVKSIDTKQSHEEWGSLKELISYFHGVSHGLFDLDEESLEQYRVRNNLKSFHVPRELLYIKVTKP